MKIKGLYIPLIDMIITLVITVFFVLKNGLNQYNGSIYVFGVYSVSLMLANANKCSMNLHNKKTAKIRKNYKRKHKNRELPQNLKEWEMDDGIAFQAIKFVLGVCVTILVVSSSYMSATANEKLGELAFGFYVDLFLLPLVLMMLVAFSSENIDKSRPQRKRICRLFTEAFTTFFYKGDKFHLFRGIFSMLFFLLFLLMSIVFTILEFDLEYYILGICFVTFSFWSVLRRDKSE